MTNGGALDIFSDISASFKFKQKIADSAGDGSIKAVKIIVPLRYLSIFSRTLEMPLIHCKINFILTWSAICVISYAAAGQTRTFAITDTKLYVPSVNLST